jgi:gamma-glutamyltranspeptidase/glutathione hydrolase
MAPAIRLAAQGFTLDLADAGFLAEGGRTGQGPCQPRHLPQGRAPLSLGRNAGAGRPCPIAQPDRQGWQAAFYRGPLAAKFVAASRAGGGIFEPRDFAAYKVRQMAPLECDYRGYHIISAPPPSSGGVVVCETLGVLAGYDMGALGFHSAAGTHLLIEALRRAYHDRNLNLGDPDFVKVDAASLASPARAAELRKGIGEKGHPLAEPGGRGRHARRAAHHALFHCRQGGQRRLGYLHAERLVRRARYGAGHRHPAQRRDGRFFGQAGEPNMYGLVEGPNNAIAPGKRPLSSMTPTIVTKDGKLSIVIGTPGSSQIPTGVIRC